MLILRPANYARIWTPNLNFRSQLDVANTNNLNNIFNTTANTQITARGYGTNYFINSFLHTIGRVLPPPVPIGTGIASGPFPFKTSQFILDDITQFSNFSPASQTFTIAHRVASQDAVLAIFVHTNAAVISSLSVNNSTITKLGTVADGTNSLLDVYYITNPPVGQIDIKVVVPASVTFMGVMAYSILGVNKKNNTPKVFSTNVTGAGTAINLNIAGGMSTSLVVDAMGANYGAFPTTWIVAQDWQRETVNESAAAATSTAINSSYMYGSGSSRNMGWTVTAGSASITAMTQIAIVLEPASPISFWFPGIDPRSLGDTSSHNADSGIGSPVIFYEGYKPTLFHKNSFLHTVGRILNPTQPVVVGGVNVPWRMMTGIGI
jgi:hypothetical protein